MMRTGSLPSGAEDLKWELYGLDFSLTYGAAGTIRAYLLDWNFQVGLNHFKGSNCYAMEVKMRMVKNVFTVLSRLLDTKRVDSRPSTADLLNGTQLEPIVDATNPTMEGRVFCPWKK